MIESVLEAMDFEEVGNQLVEEQLARIEDVVIIMLSKYK